MKVCRGLSGALLQAADAYEVEYVEDLGGAHVVSGGVSFCFLGEQDLLRGAQEACNAVDGLCKVVLLLESDLTRAALLDVQIALHQMGVTSVCVESEAHAVQICERVRKQTLPPMQQLASAMPVDALCCIPDVSRKRGQSLLDGVGPISSISQCDEKRLAAVPQIGAQAAKSVREFFNKKQKSEK